MKVAYKSCMLVELRGNRSTHYFPSSYLICPISPLSRKFTFIVGFTCIVSCVPSHLAAFSTLVFSQVTTDIWGAYWREIQETGKLKEEIMIWDVWIEGYWTSCRDWEKDRCQSICGHFEELSLKKTRVPLNNAIPQ